LSDRTITSGSPEDLGTPRVIIRVDQEEAERLGAFEEDAITREEAIDSQKDIASE
jgi:hypothetical protein